MGIVSKIRDVINKIFKHDEKAFEPDFIPSFSGSMGVGDSGTVNNSSLTAFSYYYDGTIGGNSFSFRIKKKEGKCTFSFEFMEYRDYGEMSTTLDENVLEQLKKLYVDYGVYKWDDYHMTDTAVCDGSGFSMEMGFEDGQAISASGNNMCPEGYYGFKNDMIQLLKPFADAVIEEKKNQIIENVIKNGYENPLEVVSLFIKRKGSFGLDELRFIIRRAEDGDKNFDVQILSESGKYFEIGKWNYYQMLPDEAIGFEEFQHIIEKHNIIKWYGFEGARCANAEGTEANPEEGVDEWFQLSFGFADFSIKANGYVHPSGYEDFMKELMTYMSNMIQKAEESYGLESREI